MKLTIRQIAINPIIYATISAIDIGLYENAYRISKYAYAINEPANKDLNSEAVSGLVATTGIKPRLLKSGLNIT